MNNRNTINCPKTYNEIAVATAIAEFQMPSDIETGTLLRVLARGKPKGRFLELGTGTGLSTAWILDGMDLESTLISVDNDILCLKIASEFLGHDNRLELINSDCEDWIIKNKHSKFDYIFADTWHGKYLLLDETLEMLNIGGFYIVDDMLPQKNWPQGHAEKADHLISILENRPDLLISKISWSTGLIIATK